MKRIWLLQLPIVILFTLCFWITEMGAQGALSSRFLHNRVFPPLRAVTGFFTNEKFKIRGPEKPRNKIVIVEIDSPAISEIGRWPWHRDLTAQLIDAVFKEGAKVVGLDMVFSEPDVRIPPELSKLLAGSLSHGKLANLAQRYETDPVLVSSIQRHADHLVLGWATESFCLPAYSVFDDCPVTLPEALATIPDGFSKFAFDSFSAPRGFDPQKTVLPSAVTIIANDDAFSAPAIHAGGFFIVPDADGYIRRDPLFLLVHGKPQPALALEMASVGLGEKLRLRLGPDSRVRELDFVSPTGVPDLRHPVRVNPSGVMSINFRGPGRTFPYVPALDLLENTSDTIQDPVNRRLTGMSKKALFKDAYVLIGVTAIGVFDMRAFPFDSNVAGVEGHANILDNLLSGDALSSTTTGGIGFYLIFGLMTLGALSFGYLMQCLESVQALALFAGILGIFGFIDVELLFKNGVNWDTGFLLLELFCIFVLTVAIKYIIEERNKKFIKGAFAKYVAPSVVDSILKDPSKLSLGGEKKDLTILFSDIRGFTSISEKMDAKALAAFLNDYLGIMTQIVFDHDGTLDKYIGDAVMAFWGAPLDQPRHAENAARAALAMRKALHQNWARFKSQYGVEVNIGIGINTGVVNVGNMGSEKNFEYTVIGDHVNLASRLEGLTKMYRVGVVTTRFTLDRISGLGLELPAYRTIDWVRVKGRKSAIEVVQLLEKPFDAQGLKLFEEGREFYRQRQWDEAVRIFEKARDLFSAAEPGTSDGPCDVYIERCLEFTSAPPEKEWDGAWEMHSK